MKPRVFLPAIASGVLLWLAFFPCDLGPLGFVALVPWLTLVRAPVSTKRRYFAAYLGGVTFFALAAQWVRVAHPMMYWSWLGLAVVMPLFWLPALAILRRLNGLGVPLAVSVPVAWVALEYVRMHFPTGFPFMKHVGAYQMIGFGWYFLGYTQHAFTPLIQIADVGGVYAVSFVVGAVNGALTDATFRWLAPALKGRTEGPGGASPSRPPARAGLAFALALVTASLGYGFYRLGHPAFTDGPMVAAIQGNMGQNEKMNASNRLLQSYYALHVLAFKDRPGGPDLIVWPETCQPIDWCEIVPGADQSEIPADFRKGWAISQDELLDRGWGVPVLFGLNGREWDGQNQWKYNSALLIKPVPKPDPGLAKPDDPVIRRSVAAGRYDKMHLVPFGEYVPLGDELPFMKVFTPYKHDYACRPGERWTRFPLAARDGRTFTFACLICYEDSDPYLARQYVASEPVNFLVNISNDGWFDGTEEHEQHLAICRFRAVEARRSVVRSVNMGISGVIDPDGRVVALPRLAVHDGSTVTLNEQPQRGWAESKKVEGVVSAAVPIDSRTSLYATLGDWVPALCWLVALLGAIAGLVRRTPVAA